MFDCVTFGNIEMSRRNGMDCIKILLLTSQQLAVSLSLPATTLPYMYILYVIRHYCKTVR
jgi:hypothetical protein